MTEKAVTVVVGRFDPLVGHGLAHVLGMDPGVCVLATDLEYPELERAVVRHAPQVAVVNETDESFALARLSSLQPSTAIIVLVDDPPHAYGMRVLASGATCIVWSASTADILGAIHLTAGGACVFIALDGGKVERRYPANASLLTPRETEVLELLSQGRSNPEIARVLHIGVETVRTHVANIRCKLNVQSKRELIGMPVLNRRK
ncbi:MAG: response regulator transcription factor [Solirubrobacteraceae bacterium]